MRTKRGGGRGRVAYREGGEGFCLSCFCHIYIDRGGGVWVGFNVLGNHSVQAGYMDCDCCYADSEGDDQGLIFDACNFHVRWVKRKLMRVYD